MREFKSLNPERLPEGFDAEIHGEESIVKVEESKGHIVVSYTFPGFYLSEDSLDVEGKKISFKQINIAATGFLDESGKPLLPSFGRYVQIPFNCDYKITVKKGKPVQFDDMLVSPAQEKLTDNPEEEHILEYDKEVYARDALYPEEIVKITGPFNIDDYQALLVHVCPFQYNPAKKKLIGYGNITVNIDVSPKKGEPGEYPISDPELNRDAYGNLFVNPRRRVEERLEVAPGKIVFSPFWWKRGPEFLIIYYEDFKKAAEKLAQWKKMRGLRTEIVSIDTVGNTVDEIKTYIRNKRKYIFSRLRYVLLLGDMDMIKPEEILGGPWGSNITDYYYSTPSDPPAESTTDYVLPWLSIGRIPVRKLEEATGVVDQNIAYEKSPPTDSDYYKRMVFAAYFQDRNHDGRADSGRYYIKTMEAIREHMITIGFDVERVYVTDSPKPAFYADGTPVPPDVVASIIPEADATDRLISATSEGQLLIGHRDHGGKSGWAHPPFRKNHLDGVSGDVPTPFYSLNCQTGWFDLSASTECFAEKILRMKAAAPSLVAPTRNSHSIRNNEMMKALFDAMWGGVLPTFGPATASYSVRYNRLGDILNYGKSYLPIVSTDGYSIKDHLEIYHVLGDPTLELWKAEPGKVSISAQLIKGYLYIKLSDCPKGSVITVWRKGEMIKRIEPSSTHIKIAWGESEPPLVCFWAPGYHFRQAEVEVTPTFVIADCAEGLGFFDQECNGYPIRDGDTCKAIDTCGIQAHAGYYVIGSGGSEFKFDIDKYPSLYLTMKAERGTDTCLLLMVHEKKPYDFMRRFFIVGKTPSGSHGSGGGVPVGKDCFTIEDDGEWHDYTYDLRKLRDDYPAQTVRIVQFHSSKSCNGIQHAFHFSSLVFKT